MKGYKFTTEESAQAAIASINLVAGIPKSPEAITQTWTNYNVAELNRPVFYYINHDELVEQALGQPQELTIIIDQTEL
jgi:hypothetical protein